MLIIPAHDDDVKVAGEGVGGDGSPIAWKYVASLNGKSSAISGVRIPGGEGARAINRVDAGTFIGTGKKANEAFSAVRLVVSQDGRILTL